MVWQSLGILVLAYLIGSIPTSVWLGKLYHGLDVRNYGSGNAGATNTLRLLGTKMGVIVLILDACKGWLAVRLSNIFAISFFTGDQFINFQIALAIAAMVGHVFPLYARFKGGKGIATFMGISVALYPYPVLVIIGLFLLIFIFTKYVSLGSIIAAFTFPFIVVFIFNIHTPSLVIFSMAIAIFVPITHKKNIKRLLRGEESKLYIVQRRH